MLHILDEAHVRMDNVLSLLKTTIVEKSLRQSVDTSGLSHERPTAASPNDDSAVTQCQQASPCLYDFVSEKGVDEIIEYLRECIDSSQVARTAFETSNLHFDNELQSIRDLQPDSTAESKTDADNANALVLDLFHSLESRATDMAEGLHSLVQHYDLCVTALKHTEGGLQVAAVIADVDFDSSLQIGSASIPAADPVSPGDRAEMLQILDKDAPEVEDVVQEIDHHVAEMESHLLAIVQQLETARATDARLTRAVMLLDALGRKMPSYVEAASKCSQQWSAEREQIDARLSDLDAAHDFYEGFLNAYDHMILEIARRRTVRLKMDKIAADALAKMHRLREGMPSEPLHPAAN